MKDIQPAENHTLSATLLLLTVTGAIVISISIIQYSHLLKTEQDLRKCAKVMQDSVIQENASLDGVSIKGLDKYRVQSPAFTFTLGRNNILGLPAQSITQYVSDGNWVFLKPLPVGNHSIQFKGGLRNIDTNARGSSKDKYTFAGPYGWDPPVTYRLTIAKSWCRKFTREMECACNYRTPLKYGLSPENMIGVYIVIVKDFVQFQRRNANSVVMHDEIRFGLNVWSFEADETIKGDVQVCTQGFYMPAAMAIRCCRLS